jgi:hypothetical protein
VFGTGQSLRAVLFQLGDELFGVGRVDGGA